MKIFQGRRPNECCNSPQTTYTLTYTCYINLLGTGQPTKTDEFSEKFQTAFDPPPSFLENYVAIFFRKRPKKPI